MVDRKSSIALLIALGTTSLGNSAIAQDAAEEAYNYRERVWEIAFDPETFFPDRYTVRGLSITYSGDDYGYPVYAVAVRTGCTAKDKGEARKSCFKNMVARMARSKWPEGEPERPRWRGSRLFGEMEKAGVKDDDSLRDFLSDGEVEWLEADLATCPAAMDKLMAFRDIDFQTNAPIPPDENNLPIALHADKVTLEYGSYLARSTYYGARFKGTPAAWAADFVDSFKGCWKPATDPAPWTRIDN